MQSLPLGSGISRISGAVCQMSQRDYSVIARVSLPESPYGHSLVTFVRGQLPGRIGERRFRCATATAGCSEGIACRSATRSRRSEVQSSTPGGLVPGHHLVLGPDKEDAAEAVPWRRPVVQAESGSDSAVGGSPGASAPPRALTASNPFG